MNELKDKPLHPAMRLDQVQDAGTILLLKRKPLPAADAIEYARRCGKAAAWTWSSRDRVPRPAWCARCERHMLICSDVVSIAETGMCGFCSLPELEGKDAEAQRRWQEEERRDRAELERLKVKFRETA